MKARALAQLQPWSKDVEIALVKGVLDRCDPGDCYFRAKPIEFERVEVSMPIQSAFTLPASAVQELMDDLWRCGYRPSEGEGSAGQLHSVKYHLEDMRRLLFDKKGD